jgi:hypothetical protein
MPGFQYWYRSRTASPRPSLSMALGQIDRDDVAVHVHGIHLAGGQQIAGQHRSRARADGVGGGAEQLVPHAGEVAVGLEANHTGVRARLFDDSDLLTHGSPA